MNKFLKFWQIVVEIPQAFRDFSEYYRRRAERDPMRFELVSESEGQPVGLVIVVEHSTAYDTREQAIREALTEVCLLEGKRVNAYTIVSSNVVSAAQVHTVIQPRWLSDDELAADYAPA